MQPTAQHIRHRGLRSNRFTLIELLTVLAIVAVLMGMTVGLVSNTGGQNAAVRQVSQQIYLARQHAITKREHVAILFPNDNATGDKAELKDYLGKAIKPVYYESGTAIKGEIPDTGWMFLPKGQGVSITMGAMVTVNNVRPLGGSSDELDDVQTLIFQPNGSLLNPVQNAEIKIRKLGDDDKINTGAIKGNETSIATLTVNGLTGRVTISESRHAP